MRIAYICSSTSWGGLEMNQVKNAKWMQSFGEDVVVFCHNESPVFRYCEEEQIPTEIIGPHKKYYDFKAASILANQLVSLEIDHVIIRDVRDMSTVVIAKRKAKNRFKVHYFMEMQLGVSKKNLLHTIRFSGLDTWSCPLKWLQKQVGEHTRMNPRKTVFIPSALDLSAFIAPLPKEEALKAMDLPENHFYVGLAGRFDPQKGQLLLLEALTLCSEKEIHVVLLGEPTAHEGTGYFDQMNTFIESNNLRNRVHIRKFRTDIQVFYKAIDVFVMASKAETVGMVTIEAMASNCPVIGSNAGGTPELLDFGKAGYLFEPLNPNSLAKQLVRAYNNELNFEPDFLLNQVKSFDYKQVIPQVISRLNEA